MHRLSRALAPIFIGLSALLPAQEGGTHQGRHLVEVHIRDAASLDRLLALDLDLAGCSSIELPAKTVDVVASAADLAKLERSGLEFEVAIHNLADHYETQLAKDLGTGAGASFAGLNPPVGQGGMGGHYTLAEIEAILNSFVATYPTLCSKRSLGKSVEGRDIWMVKISDNVAVDENEPEVYYDAIHHAREPVGATALLQFMDGLLSGFGTDPEATRIIAERELYCVPCVNPDGYEYNRRIRPGGGGLWRKNRRNTGSNIGVDLNRNYATGWSAAGGASTNPRSDTYKGPSPWSEPETRAIRDFWATRRFSQVFSCHTYTDVLLRPWGYQRGNPSNNAEYNRLGALFTARNAIRHGAASTILYLASGTTLDHGHTHGAFGWTPELGRRSEGGFWPSRTNQVNIANRHQHMFRQVALNAHNRTPAEYDTFGAGCVGSGGRAPVLSGTAPKLGQSMTVQLARGRAATGATLYFGGSKTTWMQQNLPLDLTAFGAAGCSLLVAPAIGLTRTTSAQGAASVQVTIPNDSQLHGAELHNQWLVLDPAANTLGVVTSNGGTGTIGI